MFVVTLTYDAPLEKVEAALADHIAWLENIVRMAPSSPRAGASPGWAR